MAYYGPDSKLNKAFYLKISLEFLLTDIFLFRLVLKQEVNLSLSMVLSSCFTFQNILCIFQNGKKMEKWNSHKSKVFVY